MGKLAQRLLTFFIGIPLVILIVWIPAFNHVVLNTVIVIVSLISSLEAYNLMRARSPVQSKPLVVTLSTLIPVSALVCALTGTDFSLTTLTLIADFMLLMVAEVFPPAGKEAADEAFSESNSRLASSLFVLLYGGFMLTFLCRMTVMRNSTAYLVVFLMMVFICDSAAWLFGMCLGKNNRGYVKASPNKSIAGFLGGIAGSIASGLLGWYLWPEVFAGSPLKVAALGLVVAAAAILGDLAESVFKRSAGCKDSGNVIPGRGGILDSIDSVLMAAPAFYFAVTVMFE